MARTHARYSPSKLDMLSLCLRFKHIEMEDGSANEGTLLHEAYETGNLNGLDAEQKRAVQPIIEYTDSLKATEGGPDCWLEVREERLTLKDLTYGSADRILIHKEKPIAHVLDAKFTRVEGNHWFQVRTYGAALVEMVNEGQFLSITKALEKVTTHIVAPRLGKLDIVEHGAQELLASVRAEIEHLYERLDDPFLPPTPHEDSCARCARASSCPALNKEIVHVGRKMGLPLPEQFAPDAMISLRDRAIGQLLASIFENWAKQVKSNNTEFVDSSGSDVPGFKMVTRSNGARIPREHTMEAVRLLKEAGYDESEILSACTISIPELAKARAAITAGGDEKDIKEELKPLLATVTSESVSKFLQKTKRVEDVALLQQTLTLPAQLGA